MSAQIFTDKMKNIQDNLLRFIEEDNNNKDENFQCLKNIFDELNIRDDNIKFKSLLNLISQISNNHQHNPNFFDKIEQVLIIFKDDIIKHFTNRQIFDIFKKNKRILLFLIEEKMLVFDDYIFHKITTKEKYIRCKYPQYFAPEIKPFLDKSRLIKNQNEDIKKELPENFYENRKEGENDELICKLIQKDMIKEFIVYINKNNYPLNSTIKPSIYETNTFLMQKQANSEEISLIEYSIFFGSIQIFKYLQTNKVKLTPSLWLYAIHGQNPEIFQILEENHIEPKSYEKCLKESIRCHHNDIANYFITNYLEGQYDIKASIKYYNFNFLSIDNSINKSIFYDLCKYDYYYYVDFLMKSGKVDINEIHCKAKDNDEERQETPLCIAIIKNNTEIVKLLLQNDQIDVNEGYMLTISESESDDKNEDIRDPWPGKSEDINRIDLKNHQDNNLNHEKTIELTKSPIFLAIEKENIEIIKILADNENLLINEGCRYSKSFTFHGTHEGGLVKSENENKTPFFMAVEKENVEIIHILLKNKKINPNICYTKKIKWEVDDNYRGDVWKENKYMSIKQSALTFAAEKENIEIIKLLIANDKIDVNNKCENSKNYYYMIDAWNCFFFSGPFYEENIYNKEEKTALIIAIENKNTEIIQLLLKNKNIDIDEHKYSTFSSWVKTPIGEKNKHCIYSEISEEDEEENEKQVGIKNEKIQKDLTALDVANEIGNIEIINLLNGSEKLLIL